MSKRGGATAAVQLVKLLVPAGKASAQPPVGPALGAKGVKAMDFAKVGAREKREKEGEGGRLLASANDANDARMHSLEMHHLFIHSFVHPSLLYALVLR